MPGTVLEQRLESEPRMSRLGVVRKARGHWPLRNPSPVGDTAKSCHSLIKAGTHSPGDKHRILRYTKGKVNSSILLGLNL